jgi:DNA invertase Pin-like site-specific DNA recombinase
MQSTIYGYARVSTEDQAVDADALTKQMQRLRDAGATQIYYDVERRTSDKRKGLLQLIKDVEKLTPGQVSKVIFTRLDRVAASPIVFYQLIDALRAKQIRVQALDDPFDLDSVGGELSVDVRLAAAKHEIKMLSLRVKKDIEVRRQQNKPHYFAPFGYKVTGDNYDKYTLNRESVVCLLETQQELTVADVARLIVETYFKVGTANATAKQLHKIFGISGISGISANKQKNDFLNLITKSEEITSDTVNKKRKTWTKKAGLKWSGAGLQTWLLNPVLAGGTPYNVTYVEKGKKYVKPFEQWQIIWSTHDDEALITIAERNRIIQMTLNNRKTRWCNSEANQPNSIFSGLIRCAKCGASYSIQASKYRKKIGRNVSHFQCNYYRKQGLCDQRTMISDIEIEKQVIKFLIKEAERLAKLAEEKEFYKESDEVTVMRQQLNQLEVIPGNNPIIEKAKDDIKNKITDVLATSNPDRKKLIMAKERIIAAFSDPEFWDSIEDSTDKKKLLNDCVKRVVVDETKITYVELKA